ncbi:MAG TPA: hypothetical protein VFM69_04880 [Pricia sp.]|nr:hypothetical protein [Pricia sp.]
MEPMATDAIKPEIPNLETKILLMLKDEFLRLNNLKVGDHIIWNFRYDTTRQAYKSRRMDKYSAREEGEGVLKTDEKGFLFVESLKDYSFYNHTNNGLTGRSRREWYQREMRKSKHYFGVGFIHLPSD